MLHAVMPTHSTHPAPTIDLRHEQLLTLAEAARLPLWGRRRGGGSLHVATIHRWATRGVRGVRLATVSVGSTKMTTLEACEAIIAGVTRARAGEMVPPPELPRVTNQRAERAAARLAAGDY